jgi:hypothetical protein
MALVESEMRIRAKRVHPDHNPGNGTGSDMLDVVVPVVAMTLPITYNPS